MGGDGTVEKCPPLPRTMLLVLDKHILLSWSMLWSRFISKSDFMFCGTLSFNIPTFPYLRCQPYWKSLRHGPSTGSKSMISSSRTHRLQVTSLDRQQVWLATSQLVRLRPSAPTHPLLNLQMQKQSLPEMTYLFLSFESLSKNYVVR